MANANDDNPRTFGYLPGTFRHPIPSVIKDVIREIHEYMMDEMSNSRRPNILPNMPRHLLCSEVISDKEKMVDIAGEDLTEDAIQKLYCYQIIIPFAVYPIATERLVYEIDSDSPSFEWSGNVISFCEILESNEEFVAIKIKGNLVKVKTSSGERESRFFPISSDKEKREELPSQPLKKFLKSPIVVGQPAGQYLISSYKLTISWLRSRLHKALNIYREVKKNVEVIATIKQKTDGPLFLRLHIEEISPINKQATEYDALFPICPAFRVTPCQLAVPVVSKLHNIPLELENVNKHCLWKIIEACGNTLREHEHKRANAILDVSSHPMSHLNLSETNIAESESEEKSEKQKTDEKILYKKSIDKVRQMNSSQCQQCEMCQNPASRMLLEYYYQHGYIPDDEMNEAYFFVWEILSFLKRSVEADWKPNGPKILEFLESGSVPEKLKVVQPDEFDVMIRIDLPRSTDGYTFVFDETFPTGFAICQVKRSKSFSHQLKRCFRKSDKFGHCLAPEQLAFGWLNGKLERAINEYKNLNQTSCKANLKLRRSGPALLLEITLIQPMSKLPRVISVDLVPTLKLSKHDSRYAVAKRAKEEHFYKMVANKPGDEFDVSNPTTDSPVDPDSHTNLDTKDEKESARKNLAYLWRISYSAQEKQYLEYVREVQQKEKVDGCQEVCLMVLKTICAREVLKQEESVICHKLSSYILKTALFHVLAKTDLIHDWKMDCLADRYVDLLDELSNWRDLPHFFYDNTSYLRKIFAEEDLPNLPTSSKNLLSELHATLKIQLFDRFAQIATSFKTIKNLMDKKLDKEIQPVQSPEESLAYHAILSDVLGTREPEEVIHPPFCKLKKPKEENRKFLITEESEDIRVSMAAKTERKSGTLSNLSRNLQRTLAAKKAAKKESMIRYIRSFTGCSPMVQEIINSMLRDLENES